MTISPLAAPGPRQLSPRPPASAQQPTVDYFGDMHLYRQLADILRDQIRSGELLPGRTVPPIPKLAQQHKIAHRTARHALAVLEDEHLIRVMHGRGTYVLPQPPG
jgi:GntR family transcriptional regulator